MTIDPQAAAHLARLAALGLPAVHETTPEESRRLAEASAPGLAGPKDPVARVEEARAGEVRVRVYTPDPAAPEPPALVYFHGGGWVMGSLDTHDAACRALAARAGCRVVSVDYRLAPEDRFPAAVEDAWTAVRWAAGRAPRLAVGGDSAGANLAAVMTLRARDAGLPLALQMLIYPVTDCDFERPSYLANADGFGLTRRAMEWYWDQYAPGPARHDPEASPLRASDLRGTAPAFVAVCELDPLRDEGVAYAERLREAGVETRLSEYEGMIHGFVRMGAVIDRTRDLVDESAEVLRQSLRLP